MYELNRIVVFYLIRSKTCIYTFKIAVKVNLILNLNYNIVQCAISKIAIVCIKSKSMYKRKINYYFETIQAFNI